MLHLDTFTFVLARLFVSVILRIVGNYEKRTTLYYVLRVVCSFSLSFLPLLLPCTRIHENEKYYTPIELYSGNKPVISHLRVFGCSAQVVIPSAQRSKWEATSKHCLFTGYTPSTRKYKFYIF